VSHLFDQEVREQPESVARLLARGRADVERIAEAIRAHDPRFVVIAARGSSDNAARYGQYLFGIHNRLTVALSAPSIITHYAAAPSLSDALVIGVSQSGQSPDVAAVLGEGRRQGAMTLALTNDPASPLAQHAAFVVPLQAGPERAVAATKTYTAQLVALAMVSAALEGSGERWSELLTLPGRMREALDLCAATPCDLSSLRDRPRLLVVGRGYNLATVFELALKIKETSYVMADPYSSADFLHGPAALLDQSVPVLAVAPTSRAFDDLEAVIRLARERHAPVIAISDSPVFRENAEVCIPLPPAVPEWLTPMVAIIPAQLLAQSLAEARGLTPDAPRGLSKVTLTR
jgi:glucosamine--fructose-6-phosphate aminotransferase (isomerizing)